MQSVIAFRGISASDAHARRYRGCLRRCQGRGTSRAARDGAETKAEFRTDRHRTTSPSMKPLSASGGHDARRCGRAVWRRTGDAAQALRRRTPALDASTDTPGPAGPSKRRPGTDHPGLGARALNQRWANPLPNSGTASPIAFTTKPVGWRGQLSPAGIRVDIARATTWAAAGPAWRSWWPLNITVSSRSRATGDWNSRDCL